MAGHRRLRGPDGCAGSWRAAEGDQSVDLSGVAAGAVSHTLTTVPGTKYTMTYALAGLRRTCRSCWTHAMRAMPSAHRLSAPGPYPAAPSREPRLTATRFTSRSDSVNLLARK
ncbi:DUF642 domain-containing protein [Streptomyces brevispora]|uniref:DUF642 domain-containing protein n=1 Tax=Streptomyces brevispora TaxID=887462 RepID=UPI002DDC3B24|nr:DUF642 domain-containing protein [Streptomyces brevispora]